MNIPHELTQWPWKGRSGRIDYLKLVVFLLLFIPPLWITFDVATGLWLIPVVGVVYWSGVWAVILLLLTLSVTPLRKIFRLKVQGLRRMLGVGALLYSVGHTVAYFALRYFDPATIAWETITRMTLIVATLSLIGLFALGVTSFDIAIKKMGAANWRRLHRGTYIFTGLAVFHFVLSPGAYGGLPFLMAGLFTWLMMWRNADAKGKGTHLPTLLWLAVVTTTLTVVLEALWPAARFGMDPLQSFLMNFSLVLGISPGWQMLMWSLGVFAAAAVHQRLRGTSAER